MSEKELCAKLQTEYERCVEALAEDRPGSDTYRAIMENITMLHWLKEERAAGVEYVTGGASPSPTIPDGSPEREGGETAPTEDGIDYKEYRLALRADLADARQQGVNTTELLRAVGVSKYSEMPDQRLPELRAELERALAEKKENG